MGEYVEADETVAVIETDKVNVDIRSQTAGVLTKYFASEGDTIEVDADFFEIDTDGKASAAPATPKAAAPETPKEEPKATSAPAQEAPKQAASAPPKAPATPPSQPKSQSQTSKTAPTGIHGSRTETRVPMSRMRVRIAQRLKDAQNTNAMLTTFNEIDMSAIMQLRKEYGE